MNKDFVLSKNGGSVSGSAPVCGSGSSSGSIPQGSGNFPPGPNTYTFNDPANSRRKITETFTGHKGLYIWTNTVNGQQYVGSSRNLSVRLSDYFGLAYFITQMGRGSLICTALVKYSMSHFTLTIHVLGPSPDGSENFGSNNLPDYVTLEQNYLNNFIFLYNVNRHASGAYNPSSRPNNVGENNPSFNVKGESAFYWNSSHSEEQRSEWSKDRGMFTFFIYSAINLSFITVVYSGAKLGELVGASKGFGPRFVA